MVFGLTILLFDLANIGIPWPFHTRSHDSAPASSLSSEGRGVLLSGDQILSRHNDPGLCCQATLPCRGAPP